MDFQPVHIRMADTVKTKNTWQDGMSVQLMYTDTDGNMATTPARVVNGTPSGSTAEYQEVVFELTDADTDKPFSTLMYWGASNERLAYNATQTFDTDDNTTKVLAETGGYLTSASAWLGLIAVILLLLLLFVALFAAFRAYNSPSTGRISTARTEAYSSLFT